MLRTTSSTANPKQDVLYLISLCVMFVASIGLVGCAGLVTANNTAANSPDPANPSITGLNPTSGQVGTSVTITGANFGSTQGTVQFNGTAGTPTSWNATNIVVLVPTGATTGYVVVTAGGTASNGMNFTVTAAAPSITSLNPTSGTIGTVVTITGTNFGATQGTSTVKFNGIAGTPTSWSATSIVVPVPAGATTGTVVVTVGGIASNGVNFALTVAGPSIISLNPVSGLVGTAVTITGVNFGATQGTSTVKFNGTAATPTSWSATSIVVPVPTGATSGNVVVNVGGVASNGVNFTVTLPPTIVSLNPTSGFVGSSVTITGTNFGTTQGSSSVKFNGTTATPTSWGATTIATKVPSGATTGNVVVTVGGIASNGVAFTVQSDTTAPSVPTGLTASAVSSSQINLSWTASTDNVGVTGYNVFRGGAKVATVATTSFSDTGLTASTSFTYTVSAFDAAGNSSAQSSSASATTLAGGSGSGGAPFLAAGQGWHDMGPATQLQISQDNNPNPAICPPDNYLSSGYSFSGQCQNVYYAWNSGAPDDDDEQLLLCAQGGHGDYQGNECYALKYGQPSAQLVRINNPTLPISVNGLAYIPDNGAASTNCNSATVVNGVAVCPNARHTYDGIVYSPANKEVMLEAGAVGPVGPLRAIDNWVLNVSTLQWTRLDKCGTGLVGISCNGQVTPGYNGNIVDESTLNYDPTSGDYFFYNNYGCEFYRQNHTTRAWTLLTTNCLSIGEYIVSAIDPVNNRMAVLGSNNQIMTISLASPYTITDQTSKCSLASSFNNGSGASSAITYDSATQQFIVIPVSLGNTVYQMDPSTFACKALTFSPANGNSAISGPPDPTNGGANGSVFLGKRAFYSAKEDAIIVAGGPFQHAYFLRLTPFAASDFANRCGVSGVILCYNFDTTAQYTHSNQYPNLSPTVRFSNQDAGPQEIFQDKTTVASGVSSMQIACPNKLAADCSGGWWTWLCQNRQCSVGPSQNGATDDFNEIYFQFRMMEDAQLANTDWEAVVGSSPKHFDLFNVQAGSCSSEELTMIRQGNAGLNGFFDVYGGCGGWSYVSYNGSNGAAWAPDGAVSPAYYESSPSGETPGYSCQYSSYAAPCAYEKDFAGKWFTVQVHLKLNSWNGNPTIGSGTNVLEMWVAGQGQKFAHWKYFPGTAFFQQQGSGFKGFDTLLFEDYMTSMDTSVSFPTAHLWIDELIISTKPISTPHGVAP